MITISGAFDPRRNSLNALRLALACLVIASHSRAIGGYGPDWGFRPLENAPGEWAVAGFFAISGFLITESREKAVGLLDYAWRRVLRIYPAFLVCLVVVAFGFAPLSALLFGGDYSGWSALGYVVHNAALWVQQPTIDGTLTVTPFQDEWNGPLWTLFYEFMCYVAVGVLVSLVPRRRLGVALSCGFVLCVTTTLLVTFAHFPLPYKVALMPQPGSFFVAGALLHVYRDRVGLNGWVAAAALPLSLLLFRENLFYVLGGPVVGYLMLYLAIRLPLTWVGARNDVSYGMYIYGFPVQQCLYLAFGHRLPLSLFVLASVVLTLPLAAASWFLVEKPALRKKALFGRRATPPEANSVYLPVQPRVSPEQPSHGSPAVVDIGVKNPGSLR